MLIADTSAWVEWLRQRESPADLALDQAFADDLLVLLEPVKAELLMGARDRAEVGTLRRLLETVDFELVYPRDDFESATELFHTARRRGVTVRGVTDCLDRGDGNPATTPAPPPRSRLRPPGARDRSARGARLARLWCEPCNSPGSPSATVGGAGCAVTRSTHMPSGRGSPRSITSCHAREVARPISPTCGLPIGGATTGAAATCPNSIGRVPGRC